MRAGRKSLHPSLWFGLGAFWVLSGCSRPSPTTSPAASSNAPVTGAAFTAAGPVERAELTVTSPAFGPGGSIPARHTCEGEDRSLPLAIAGVPPNAKTLAVIVDDPDAPDPAAPKTVWVHFVAYDLPASSTTLPEGAGNGGTVGRAGKNDWGSTGYRGPCPPVGRHRYFVKVFALDSELGDLHEPTKAALLQAMEGHLVGEGALIGTYQKTK